MTAVPDIAHADPVSPSVLPVRLADGGRLLARAVQRLTGAALFLSALGLWLAPGASWESDVMLFKLIMSLTAGLAGLGLMQSSASPEKPEVEIDLIRREVRLVRAIKNGKSKVLQRCGFTQLARAEHEGNYLRLWDNDDVFLAEVCLSDRTALYGFMAALRSAGKLA